MRTRFEYGALPNGRVYALATTLCLLAPFVAFLTANNYPIFAAEVLPLHIAGLAAGIVIAAFAKMRLIILVRLSLWTCLVLAIAFLYNLDSIVSVTALAMISGIAVWMLRDNAATILLIAAAVHIGSTVGLHQLSTSNTPQADFQHHDTSLVSNGDLPPVLHLVLDEFAGLRGLPSELSGSQELASKLVDFYLEHGFDLYSHAYSQYFETSDSLTNLVNFSSSTHAQAYVVDSNKYFEYLLHLGYALHVYQSSYLNFCAAPGAPVTSCSTYQSNSIASIRNVDMPYRQKTRFILNSFLDSSVFLRKVRQTYLLIGKTIDIPIPAWPTGNSRTGPLAVIPTLENLKIALRELSPGDAYFAHLMLPHYPYSLDRDCTLKPLVHTWLNRTPFEITGKFGEQNTAASRAERYGQYMAQVECTQAILEDLFAAIRASGQWQQSIILIHGDHGSRIVRRFPTPSDPDVVEDDFRDAYSTFFAFKNGTSTGKLNSSVLPLQVVLARAWQLPIPQQSLHQVYMHESGQKDLVSTPLLGFEPMLQIQTTPEKD